MSLIKGVVIGMGVLIVAGFVVIAVTLVMRTQGSGKASSVYRTNVSLPPGTSIVQTEIANGQVLLRLAGAGGESWLVVIDSDKGTEQGRIQLVPEAP